MPLMLAERFIAVMNHLTSFFYGHRLGIAVAVAVEYSLMVCDGPTAVALPNEHCADALQPSFTAAFSAGS
jgi:hypothetical protein